MIRNNDVSSSYRSLVHVQSYGCFVMSLVTPLLNCPCEKVSCVKNAKANIVQ